MSLQSLFQSPIHHLGDSNPKLTGIYSALPLDDSAMVERYIHSQFLDHAEAYAKNYQHTEYERLLTEAFTRENLNGICWDGKVILDIGSGSGNSIFPLLKICKGSRVIASDLSIPLLHILRNSIAPGQTNHFNLLQLNAETLDFRPESVDLVVGAAILHHLFDPEKTISGCARILKPGGKAIFFEPFENGNAILKLVFMHILRDPRAIFIRPGIRRFFKDQVKDLDFRMGRDKSSPAYLKLDDKWLFTRRYFSELAEKYGFTRCNIHPMYSTQRMVESQVTALFHLIAGRSTGLLPNWAWNIIRWYDDRFSEDMWHDLFMDGCVVLSK